MIEKKKKKKLSKPSKGQINSRVELGTIKAMKQEARLRGATESSIVDAAIKLYLRQTEHESVVDRRLDKLQKQLERLSQDQQLYMEMLARFVNVYLTHTPEISPEQKKLMEDQGNERFGKFVDFVLQAVKDKCLFRDLLEQRIMEERDFRRAEV